MKKIFAVLLISTIMWACHRRSVSPPDIIISNKKTQQQSRDSTASTSARPDSLALGRLVYENRCGRCHELKKPELYNQVQWQSILTSMIPKARLNEEESRQVTAYLMRQAKK